MTIFLASIRFRLLLALVTSFPLLSFAQLPDGAGKAVFLKVCSGCHPAEAVLGRMDSPRNWARKVDSMINRGAQATPDEINQINEYLNRNFTFVPSRVHLPDGPGKDALQRVCGSCHAAEIVFNRDGQAGSRAQWDKTIDRMLMRGAAGTPETNWDKAGDTKLGTDRMRRLAHLRQR